MHARIQQVVGIIVMALLIGSSGVALATPSHTPDTTQIVTFGGGVGNTYSPATVNLSVGDTVEWQGSFGGHPLASEDNLWAAQSSGSSFSHTFTSPGSFRFFCQFHGSTGGVGMAGIVNVGASPPATSAASLPARRVFTEFRATLLQSNEVSAPTFTGANGSANIWFDPASRTLDYRVTVSGITPAVAAHIHKAPVGVNGGVVFDLLGTKTLSATSVLTGQLTLSAAQVDDLYRGNYYVNVHTVAFPGGELRGQIFPREFNHAFSTGLRGDNEVPPVVSPATGSAKIWLNDRATSFSYEVAVADMDPATMAHIHTGPITGTGGVAFDLLGSKALSPTQILTGSLPINPLQVVSLYNGLYYVNVHTATNPGGEIRGQLGPASTRLWAPLNGANERPTPVNTPALGRATFDLSEDSGRLEFEVRVSDLINVTGAHIHIGPITGTGGVLFDLLNSGGGVLTPDQPLRGVLQLSQAQVSTLLSEGYYVNVHTAANPGGEIRGQIREEQRFLTYRVALNGANERPTPVATAATGSSSLTVDSLTNQLHYKLAVQGLGEAVTGAHIHLGDANTAGPVVFPLANAATLTPQNPITGTIQLSDAQFAVLTGGGFYINVHTATNPGGAIRGQIYPNTPPQEHLVGLTGAQQVPAVSTSALGNGDFLLSELQTALPYSITFSGLTAVQQAHIHRGAAGVNGPVVVGLYNGSGPFTNQLTGTVTLNPGLLNDLLLSHLYVNVHTTANPSGEIRGQIFGVRARVYTPLLLR